MRWVVIAGLATACGDNAAAVDAPVPVDTSPDAPSARLTISPETWDFGSLVNQTTSAPNTFRVTNLGGTASAPLVSSLTGLDAARFIIALDGCASVLPVQSSCVVDVIFAPTSAYGSSTATLRVGEGAGQAVEASLEGSTHGKDFFLTATPGLRDFGSVIVGQTSTPQAFTITNFGAGTGGPLMIYFNGTDPTQFANVGTDTCTGQSLAPGASCMFSLAFEPTFSGLKEASIYVTRPIGPGVTIAVRGTATP